MPQETERPVEKLLRAFGKRRREAVGSNFELHPATRRMLQGEVAGQLGAQAAKARLSGRPVWRLWPKLAWGLGACSLAVFGIWLLRPKATDSERETLLARNEVQERAAQRAAGGLPAAANNMTTPVVELRDQTSTAATNALLLALGENRPAPVLAPPEQRVVETISMENSAQLAKSGAAAVETTRLAAAPEAQKASAIPSSSQTDRPQSAATAAAAMPTGAAQLNQLEQNAMPANDSLKPAGSGAALSIPPLSSVTASTAPSSAAALGKDQFAAVFRALPNQSLKQSTELRAKSGRKATDSPTPVLASFELEQVGGQVRVIDHDGSVYTGDLQSVPGAGASARARAFVSSGLVREQEQGARPAAAEPGSLTLGGQTYYFSVSGTNVSLKQPVLFFGRLIESSNAAQANPPTPLAPLPATAAFQRLQSSPVPTGLTRRVSGKAIVGNKTEFTVEAVSPSSQPGN